MDMSQDVQDQFNSLSTDDKVKVFEELICTLIDDLPSSRNISLYKKGELLYDAWLKVKEEYEVLEK